MPRVRTAPLSRDQIFTAALALVDAEGFEALSMRRLARYGSGWNPWGEEQDDVVAAIPLMREAVFALGRDPSEIEVLGHLPLVPGRNVRARSKQDLARTRSRSSRHTTPRLQWASTRSGLSASARL